MMHGLLQESPEQQRETEIYKTVLDGIARYRIKEIQCQNWFVIIELKRCHKLSFTRWRTSTDIGVTLSDTRSEN